MCFNQTGDISTQSSSSLKLVDKLAINSSFMKNYDMVGYEHRIYTTKLQIGLLSALFSNLEHFNTINLTNILLQYAIFNITVTWM